jgi:hypothetical protein
LPISTGVSGLGTNVATALAVNVGSSGAFVTNGGALGTPSSGTVTNLTGTASININGTVGATTATTGKFTTLEATGVTTVQAGSVSAPAITTTGDTNTGIYFPAADTIAFTEGGVEAMRIFSSSGVSIGNTTDPGAKNLSVSGSLSLVVTGSATALATKATTVLTSAVEIAPLNGTWGHLAIVTGLDPLEGFFTDLVFSSITAGPTVLSSKTVSASPSARTYSMSGSSFLSLAMASGTYEVRCSVFYGLS